MASGQTARERTDLNCSKSRQINNFEADGRSNIYQNQVEFSTMLRKVSRSTCRSSFALFLVLGASLIIIDISLSERATCHLIGSTVSKLKIERELFVVGLDMYCRCCTGFYAHNAYSQRKLEWLVTNIHLEFNFENLLFKLPTYSCSTL